MRLVDRDQRQAFFGEHLGKAGNAEALGSDEQELQVALQIFGADLAGVEAFEAGVNAADTQAERREFGGLVSP